MHITLVPVWLNRVGSRPFSELRFPSDPRPCTVNHQLSMLSLFIIPYCVYWYILLWVTIYTAQTILFSFLFNDTCCIINVDGGVWTSDPPPGFLVAGSVVRAIAPITLLLPNFKCHFKTISQKILYNLIYICIYKLRASRIRTSKSIVFRLFVA